MAEYLLFLSLILDLPTAVAVLALCSFIQTVIQSVQNRMYIHWQKGTRKFVKSGRRFFLNFLPFYVICRNVYSLAGKPENHSALLSQHAHRFIFSALFSRSSLQTAVRRICSDYCTPAHDTKSFTASED